MVEIHKISDNYIIEKEPEKRNYKSRSDWSDGEMYAMAVSGKMDDELAEFLDRTPSSARFMTNNLLYIVSKKMYNGTWTCGFSSGKTGYPKLERVLKLVGDKINKSWSEKVAEKYNKRNVDIKQEVRNQ